MAEPANSESEDGRRSDAARSPWRELLIGGAHLAGLWAIAIAQPLLDLLGSNPEFFVARGNTTFDILVLAIGFTLGPPVALMAFEGLVRLLGRTPYLVVHLVLITLLAAMFFIQIEKAFFDEPTALIIGLALVLAGLLAYGLTRFRFVRGLLDVLAIAPIVFLVAFLFFSGTSRLVLPQDEAVALGGEVKEDTPVVMVIFDELPAASLMTPQGTLDAQRFPGFAALARQGTYYPNNTTTADFTARAVPPIMTGKRATGRELPIAADQPESIFTLLGDSYSFNVSESITQICPESLCGEADTEGAKDSFRTRMKALVNDLKYVEGRLILPPELADKLPNVSTTFGDFGGDEEVSDHNRAAIYAKDLFSPPSPGELDEFVEQIPAGGRTLSLIHMELPHEPFQFLPDGRVYNSTEVSNLNTPSAQRWDVGDPGIASIEQRHYLQTAYADRLIQIMVSRLKEVGIWDDAMVVITADHGISFKARELRRIAVQGNLGGVANPPLFIKYPNQNRGQVSLKPTRTTDVVPTIAETLGVDNMYETDGVPISSLEPDSRTELELENATGETVTAPLEQVFRQRDQVIATSRARLGYGDVWSLGPAPQLLGRQVGEATDGEIAELDQPDLLGDFSAGADPVRVFVAGRLDDSVGPSTTIAIAVNGRIAATTRAFLYEDELRFGVIVPPQSLRTGYNPVGIYAIGPTGEPELLGGA